MDRHDKRLADDGCDRCDVADEIEIEVVVERRVDRVRRSRQEERVAVRRRLHDRLGTDIAAGTRPVLDDELLAEPLGQPMTDQARGDVGSTTGGKSDDNAHWPRRIGLRPRDARQSRQRGSARGQMQELSTGKFHLNLPSDHSITSSARASTVGGISRPSALAVLRLITSSYYWSTLEPWKATAQPRSRGARSVIALTMALAWKPSSSGTSAALRWIQNAFSPADAAPLMSQEFAEMNPSSGLATFMRSGARL